MLGFLNRQPIKIGQIFKIRQAYIFALVGAAIPLVLMQSGVISRVVWERDQTWAFQPEVDTYAPDALLDLRSLNETVAGESGFIGLSDDGQDFVKGDGTSIRFWAVNSSVHKQGPEALADHARFLAKRGVNLVRWHGNINSKEEDSRLTDIDKQAREELWQYVAAMKQEGIYVTLSPYYPHITTPQPEWDVPRDSDGMTGLLFFDPKMQAAYKAWLRKLLKPVNPYTGVALKDEAAIALIQLQNEDSLLFWTVNDIQGKDLDLLSRQFSKWLTKKYGSLDKAVDAWQGETVEGDDLDRGLPRFYAIWEMTQGSGEGGKAQRLSDQTEFWTETMRQFNEEMVQFLREDIGASQLVNAGNWKTADASRLNDAERYSYTPGEVMGVNRYYDGVHTGENSTWAITDGHAFTNPSALLNPQALPTNLKQVTGHPMIISESSWVPPINYHSEAPFLVSLFQSLGGVDAFYWFTMQEPQWREPSSANGFLPSLGKWVTNTPELLGNFPAAALMYRQGYIQRGTTVVRENRSLDDLWTRQLPIISEENGFDPNRDQADQQQSSQQDNQVNPLAFLVGPVEVTYDANPDESTVIFDLEQHIDRSKKVVRSITDEIHWDYKRGLCTINAPKAQGASGFLKKQGKIALNDITVKSRNDYATVIVAAMDDKPITTSQKLLVQTGTVARPTGWEQEKATWQDENNNRIKGFEILDYGQSPWEIEKNYVTVTINNPDLTQATALDMNGEAKAKVKLRRGRQKVSFRMPEDAKYVVLE